MGTITYRAITLGAALAAASGGAITLASPASADKYDKWLAVDCPQPYSQTCTPRAGMWVPAPPNLDLFGGDAGGPLFVEFTGEPGGCADIAAHLYVNGKYSGNRRAGPAKNATYLIQRVAPELSVDLGGADDGWMVEIQGEGLPGGCNTGSMSGWAGNLHVETGAEAEGRAGVLPP